MALRSISRRYLRDCTTAFWLIRSRIGSARLKSPQGRYGLTKPVRLAGFTQSAAFIYTDQQMGVNTETLSDVPKEYLHSAEIIWEYMLMHSMLEKSQLILVLGNNDIRVAQHAAKLWLEGYADYILFSGDLGNLTKGKWTRPEYEVFRDVALKMGVPYERILVEKCATNTGENVRFSYEVLRNLGLVPTHSIILVQAPYMERRTYATFMKQWPEVSTKLRVQVTSPPVPLRKYPNDSIGTLQDIISIMLGCLQRIIVYPAKGYHIYQEIPDNVVNAYKTLTSTKMFSNFMVKA